MEVLGAIDAIDDLVHRSRGFRGSKRVDAAAYQEGVQTVRAAIHSDIAEPGSSGVLAIVARLEAIGTSSSRVPGVVKLRLSSDEFDKVMDDLRQCVSSAIIEQRKRGR